MRSTIFILVPSPHPTGPIKGAFALANALVAVRNVIMVYLKNGPGVDAALDSRVEEISLANISGGWLRRLLYYKRLLQDAGGRGNVGSISICFSADLLNAFCSRDAVICSSVRGNLLQNYRYTYRTLGIFLAIFHLLTLRSFDRVVAMTGVMAKQIYSIARIPSMVIGNFVDENALEHFRSTSSNDSDGFRLVYIGSLTDRKQPHLIVNAVQLLVGQGYHVRLDIVGDGPLRGRIDSDVARMGLQKNIYVHGHVINPYPIIANADAFVLPSRSEGMSRAALEALHLGVPCVLRKVDGNAELLASPAAGVLFSDDHELPTAILCVVNNNRKRPERSSLLPPSLRQAFASMQYLGLVEEIS
jgi:glycosyltransferase involved in cell wall biosynthesis